MRSRVMPGSSPTMERREPVRRLKRVDLPTLGRPQMAMRGEVRRFEAARSGWRGRAGRRGVRRRARRGCRRGIRVRGGRCWRSCGVWRPTIRRSGGAGGLLAGGGVCLGAMVRRDSLSGERVGVRFFFSSGGALGGEGFALAGIDRSGGGRGARGAALLGAGGCLAMLLAEAFSVVALRHGECLPETRCA